MWKVSWFYEKTHNFAKFWGLHCYTNKEQVFTKVSVAC